MRELLSRNAVSADVRPFTRVPPLSPISGGGPAMRLHWHLLRLRRRNQT
ncbi:Uncharacterised protein [Amycolatopsis camponoti]|uniref:Uncharacterized protein n=1 Tax=Amycolatopsis camponoti TaxID=2606593 RepID=A0A6I8LZH1_9PSEU|nr:Uncharacterised protein [Amycolatopsis camponoti]